MVRKERDLGSTFSQTAQSLLDANLHSDGGDNYFTVLNILRGHQFKKLSIELSATNSSLSRRRLFLWALHNLFARLRNQVAEHKVEDVAPAEAGAAKVSDTSHLSVPAADANQMIGRQRVRRLDSTDNE